MPTFHIETFIEKIEVNKYFEKIGKYIVDTAGYSYMGTNDRVLSQMTENTHYQFIVTVS